MSLGTWLFGAAVSAVVLAYVARPFRRDALDARFAAAPPRGRQMKRLLWLLPLLALLLAIAALPGPPGRNLIAEAGLGLIALALGLGIAYQVWTAPDAEFADHD